MAQEAIHINYALQLLDLAAKYRQKVDLRAWKKTGRKSTTRDGFPSGHTGGVAYTG